MTVQTMTSTMVKMMTDITPQEIVSYCKEAIPNLMRQADDIRNQIIQLQDDLKNAQREVFEIARREASE